ncbi:MAG TPA: glycosyltransferase family 2 protein [Candidatus Limnocylindrales bacterium]|nr:glycosyltransferase family 2 protein [Candidatus Limnocylindrales bacterium]
MPASTAKRSPDLAVIIVSWNVRALVLEALNSLYADLDASGLHAQVLLVDSASSDGTTDAVRAAFPQTRVFAETGNLGFVRGNNLALRALGLDQPTAAKQAPRAVYLLNPDTITQPGATRALFDALFAERRTGLVGARLSYADGAFQHGAFAFPGLRQLWAELFPTPGRWREGRFNGRYRRTDYDGNAPFPVDFVLGAAMMLRAEAIRDAGLFDEGFTMYCEEIDWAWRLRRIGWEARCVPAAHVVHLGGQSSGQIRPQSLVHLWTSRLRLFDLYYPAPKRWLAHQMVRLGTRRLARDAVARGESPEVIAAYEHIRALV